ncbi:LOW QUALITY PROTEIN: syncytin-2-like [Strix aluco]|uniref:LOW QUALITY PROTEIN: syncytin-2-like n=1 Tax=Strix aluco TaxID=111821 RepID=UPI003DA58DFB
MHCKAHQKENSTHELSNAMADREAKRVAEEGDNIIWNMAILKGLWFNYSYDCIPDGHWWLCGDGRARKSLPKYWDGDCTLGYVIPQDKIYNHSHPPPGFIRTPWRKVRRALENPLIKRPTAYHSFVRWVFPQLGVSELEKAIVNISATMEKIVNSTVDAIQGLQVEISSLSKVVLQNRMVLYLITAKEGGVCLIINQSCCSYISQGKRIETDMTQIWQQSKILHQITQDNTSLGFTNLWEKLTSWLPDLTWLKQLFIACVLTIILGILICCMLRCFMWICKYTSNHYGDWKRHQLCQKVESGAYFAKTLKGNGMI